MNLIWISSGDNYGANTNPVLVGQSSSPHATMSSWGRKVFWAQGYYWVFYTNGTDPMYKTSENGILWGNSTYIGTGNPDGKDWDVYYNNSTNVLYYCAATSSNSLEYRWGNIESTPSIKWSIPQTKLNLTAGVDTHECTVTSDSLNNVWFVFEDRLQWKKPSTFGIMQVEYSLRALKQLWTGKQEMMLAGFCTHFRAVT